MENEMNMMSEIKELINILVTKIDATESRVSEMENVVFNQLLAPISQAYEKADYDDRLGTFKETYNEKFAPIDAQVKAVEGEDFDIAKNTFDDYNAMPEPREMEEAEYVDAVVEKVVTQLEDIKEKLNNAGIPAETVTVETSSEGVEVQAKDEEGNIVATEEEIEEVVDSDVEVETNPDELASFEDELNSELDKTSGK